MNRATAGIIAGLLASSANSQFTIETVADNLEVALVACIPAGRLDARHRTPGRVRMIRDGELLEAPVAGVPDVYFAGQGGLFDVVLDPDFESNQTIYLSYAHGDQDANATRILRAVLDATDCATRRSFSPSSRTRGGHCTSAAASRSCRTVRC